MKVSVLEHKRFELTTDKRALLEAMLHKRGLQTVARSIPRRQAKTDAPLSFAQQRLWLVEQMHPGTAVNNIPAAFRLREHLDIGKLESALTRLVTRHEALRARFTYLDGTVRQVFAHESIQVEVTNLSNTPPPSRENDARQAARHFARIPFNLETGPLLRAKVITLDPKDHIIVVSLHHIAADGWSMKLFARELAAFIADRRLPELPIGYADYAAWQRGWLTEERLGSHFSYWEQELSGYSGSLEIPHDLPRPSTLSTEGARLGFRIPQDLLQSLEFLAAKEEATLFMVLMAAWQTLLFRYSGQSDIVTGTPVAGRTRPETAQLIGFFVNMLAIRTQITPDASFRSVIRNVREKTVKAYDHQDLPFDQLIDRLPLRRDANRTPLFQTVFVLQNASEGLSAEAGREIEIFHIDTGCAKFDLTLDVAKDNDGASAFLEYRTDLFTQEAIVRLQKHFLALLRSIAQQPSESVGRLAILDSPELDFVTRYRNLSPTAETESSSIQEEFAKQVQKTPDALAITFEGQSLTYTELNRRANTLAAKLLEMGAGPEVRVAMCIDRSIDTVVGILGILKCGAAYVPIDPSSPPDRVTFVLTDAKAPILVTTKDRADSLPSFFAKTLLVEETFHDYGEDITAKADANSTAYVIYTSGSTGKPKGVVVEHRNVLRLLRATEQWFHFDERDVWTLFHSYAFDFSVWELWGALLYGGRLVIVPYWISRSPEEFYRLLCDEGVTVLNQTPSAFRQLVAVEDRRPLASQLRLRYVIFGGEALEVQSLRSWFQRHPVLPKLVNMYGITETTVHVTYRELSTADLESNANSVVGIPIPDLQVYLLDQFQQPVPVGIPGELYVGGDGVARGYHDRPDLTATRFVPDPLSSRRGARLYRSGDLARWLPNGDLDYLGRIDDQVKLRGFRIEIGEIESVLNQHPAVAECSVIVRNEHEASLAAYIVCRPPTSASAADLRDHLKRALPDYMCPSTFTFLEKLPLTVNGKVDRKALPAPEAKVFADAEGSEPSTETERKLADIWCQVLRIPKVGRRDNFFELGGDSILTIQAVARANQSGMRITPKQLFETQTIESLAAIADAQKGAALAAIQITAGQIPLSPIQHWFFGQNLPNPHYWNQAVLLELQQPTESKVLAQAYAAATENHAAFHLRFELGADGWIQTYDKRDTSNTFEEHDFSALPESEAERELLNIANRLHRSLNITVGPVSRAAHITFGASKPSKLLLIAHHLIVDGISWRVLVEDLEIACGQLSEGQCPNLPTPSFPFPAWPQRLERYANSEDIVAEKPFWVSHAEKGAEIFPRRGNHNLEGEARSKNTHLAVQTTQTLVKSVPAAYHTKINDALLAALALAVTRTQDVYTVTVDLEGHGRETLFEEFDLSRSVGWFTTIYPVTLEVSRDADLGQLLKTTKELLRTIPRNGIGYGIARYLSRSVPDCAPSLSFNYLGQLDNAESGSRLFRLLPGEWGATHDPAAKRKHDIDITAYISAEQLHVTWAYSPSLATEVDRLSVAYLKALQDIVEHCSAPQAGGFTPSDFPQAKVKQQDLDKLMGTLKLRALRKA